MASHHQQVKLIPIQCIPTDINDWKLICTDSLKKTSYNPEQNVSFQWQASVGIYSQTHQSLHISTVVSV